MPTRNPRILLHSYSFSLGPPHTHNPSHQFSCAHFCTNIGKGFIALKLLHLVQSQKFQNGVFGKSRPNLDQNFDNGRICWKIPDVVRGEAPNPTRNPEEKRPSKKLFQARDGHLGGARGCSAPPTLVLLVFCTPTKILAPPPKYSKNTDLIVILTSLANYSTYDPHFRFTRKTQLF